MKTKNEALLEIGKKTLPQLLVELGVTTAESCPGQKILCPFHADKNPSLTIGERSWKCWAGCGEGDVLDFFQKFHALNPGKVFSVIGKNATAIAIEKGRDGEFLPKPPAQQGIDWLGFVREAKPEFIAEISHGRGYKNDILAFMREQFLFANVNGHAAFPIIRDGVVVGAHVRGDDHWFVLPKGTKMELFVIGDVESCDDIFVFESQWDALAVLDALQWHESALKKIAVIVTRGAGNGRLIGGKIPKGKRVFVFPQNDPLDGKGESPAKRWLGDVVNRVDAPVLLVKTPGDSKDANDWLKNCDDAVELAAAIAAAQLVDVQKMEMLAPRKPDSFEAYYDRDKKTYWIKNERGEWIEISETSLKRHLRAANYSPKILGDDPVSPLDQKLIEIQAVADVSYAGRLAGYSKGLVECCGKRILITESPVLIEPQPGDWPILRQLLEGMLEDQLAYLLGWLKVSIESLRSGQTRPNQILVLAGPAGSGKSLVQNLITEMLGGRVGKPYRYMAGDTSFNGDLVESEHLAVEDEVSSTNIAARRHFGSRVKEFTVNEVQSCHAKYRQALSLKPFWRVTVSVNDEPENLMILPPMDDSLLDKFILLKAALQPMPMATQSLRQRKIFWDKLLSELPAFIRFLLQEFQIPDALKSERFGVTHFHHPDILSAISELSPEVRLLNLIDQWFRENAGVYDLRGTAWKIECELKRMLNVGHEVRDLFSFNTACGVYLGRLAQKYPKRFRYHRDARDREWLILHPDLDEPRQPWPPKN
jgi:hypothetical protein